MVCFLRNLSFRIWPWFLSLTTDLGPSFGRGRDGKVEIPVMGGALFFFFPFFFTLKNSKLGKFVKSFWSLMWLFMIITILENNWGIQKGKFRKSRRLSQLPWILLVLLYIYIVSVLLFWFFLLIDVIYFGFLCFKKWLFNHFIIIIVSFVFNKNLTLHFIP